MSGEVMTPLSSNPKNSVGICNNKSYDEPDNPNFKPDISPVPPVRYPSTMQYEENRLSTYRNSNWKCEFMDINKLAKCGFYYIGKDDHVKCAFCKVEIGKWEPGDDVDADHQRWAPRCPFLRGLDVGNVPIGSTEGSHPKPSGYDTCGNGVIEVRPNSGPESELLRNELGIIGSQDVNLTRLGVHPHSEPSFKSYSTYESRISSFKEWPRGMKQRPEQLAEAGFFYTGKGDQTLCFYCGGGLKDWLETDEPWEQHAKWFSKCTFVLMSKGNTFVRNACSKDPPIISAESARELTNNKIVEVSPPKLEKISTKPTEDSADESIEDYRLCKICYNEPLGVLFLPCGHIVACVKCAPSLSTCAVCRSEFTATVRAFLP